MASPAPASATPARSATESEVLVRDFLAANPFLGSDLDASQPSVLMTDRYTNAEWAAQIAETQRKVQVDEGRKYEVPKVGNGDFARTIDHTLLKLDATKAQIDALCAEARTEGFKSVCVRLNHVQRCIANLKGSPVVVACVVGFHEGTQDTLFKLEEARAAVAAGASELDVVLNYTHLTQGGNSKDTATQTAANTHTKTPPAAGDAAPATGPYATEDATIPGYSAIYRELASIRTLCPSPTVLKLILETSQLSRAQILAASHLAAAANFDFIKTSTGFNGPGAKLEDVRLMVAAAEYLSTRTESNGGSPVRQRKMQVKASGGVRSLEDAVKMLEAGATRLGTSSGLWIMQQSRTRPSQVSRMYTDESVGGY